MSKWWMLPLEATMKQTSCNSLNMELYSTLLNLTHSTINGWNYRTVIRVNRIIFILKHQPTPIRNWDNTHYKNNFNLICHCIVLPSTNMVNRSFQFVDMNIYIPNHTSWNGIDRANVMDVACLHHLTHTTMFSDLVPHGTTWIYQYTLQIWLAFNNV
jgi:hypothetical protein